MHPILFQFGPLKIYSYGLFVALAFIAGTYLAKSEASRQNMVPERILDLSLCLAISGILGARLLYILQNLRFYIRNPGEILMLYKGGLSFYGGFILAVICAIIFLRRGRLPLLKTLDIIVPYLALGQAIGRIGCLLNSCCYGRATDSLFGVYFPGEVFARHPTQIYSSLSLLSIFVILRILQAKKVKIPGQIFLLYCLLYSAIRFSIEYLRGDNLRILANLTIHQLISIGIFVISGLFLWKRRKGFALRPRAQMKA